MKKNKKFSKKMLGMFVVVLVLMIVGVNATAWKIFKTSDTSITIAGGCKVTGQDGSDISNIVLSGMAGDTLQKNFTITNMKSIATSVGWFWNENSNPNKVNYTTYANTMSGLQPHSSYTWSKEWTISPDSPEGEVKGNLTFMCT